MNNNTKKYEMGGAIQSFSSPMLATGMQGGLSGFGTSGLGMFEKGGLLGKDDLDFLDSINDQHKMADGGQMSDIERILAKYRDIQSNQPKKDPTKDFLSKSWEGKNIDDYVMYSDRYKKGGEVGEYANGGKLSPAQERAFFDKTKTKYTQLDADKLVGNFIEIYGQGQEEAIAFSKISKATIDPNYSEKTLVISTETGTQERIPEDKIDSFFNGLPIVLSIPSKGEYYGLKLKKEANKKDLYADGGEVNKYEAIFDQLKKGDVVNLEFGSSISRSNDVKLVVKSKNLVGKGKTYESEKITFAQVNNPDGVKFYAYKRKSGYIGFASGDMGINVTNISIVNKFGHGGSTSHSNNGKINGEYLDSVSEIKQRRILMNIANHYQISLEEANDEVRDDEAELLYEYIADDQMLKTSLYHQFQDRKNKFEDGGVTFIEYKDNEIMYEPTFNKYYANDVEFDTLEEAQSFLDSGEMSDLVRGAYERGLFAKGGKVAAKFKVGDKVVGQFRYEYGEGLQPVSLYDYADRVNGVISEVKKREDVTLYVIKFDNGEELQYPDFAIDNFIAKRSFAKGGKVIGDSLEIVKENAKSISENRKQNTYVFETLNIIPATGTKYLVYTWGEDADVNHIKNISHNIGGVVSMTIISHYANGDLVSSKKEVIYKNNSYAKGGEVKGVSIGDNVYAYFAHNYMGYQIVESPMMGEPYDGEVIDIVTENNKKKYVVKFENGVIDKMSQVIFDDYVTKYAKGGKTSSQKIYEVEYEIGGKKHTSQFLMYDLDRVENLLPPATKIISIKEKLAKGGEVEEIKLYQERLEIGKYLMKQLEEEGKNSSNSSEYRGFERLQNQYKNRIARLQQSLNPTFPKIKTESLSVEDLKKKYSRALWNVNELRLGNLKPSKVIKEGRVTKERADQMLMDMANQYKAELEKRGITEYAKGGKIGFEGLANKVAKRYIGKKVSKEYQGEYGKTYDQDEAKEVGNKVAGKVYKQQVAKKKIVRKLQRKTK
jgi:hypothetical protein